MCILDLRIVGAGYLFIHPHYDRTMSAGYNSSSIRNLNYPSSGFIIGVIITSCVCLLLGILGNVGVIIYNIFMNHTKTPTTYFVTNLAVSDIIVCCSFFPTWIVKSSQILGGREVGSANMICKISVSISGTSVALSVANLLAITIDRFIFISRPLKYPVIMTWEKTYFILSVVWVLCSIDAGILFFQNQDETDLIYCRTNSQTILAIDLFTFYIPVLTLIYLNYKIFKVARRQGRQVTSQPVRFASINSNRLSSGSNFTRATIRQLRLIKTFLVLLGMFLLCFIPYAVVKTMDIFHCTGGHCVPTSVYVCSILLVGVNSVCNPFIYGIRLKEYRNALRNCISKIYSVCT